MDENKNELLEETSEVTPDAEEIVEELAETEVAVEEIESEMEFAEVEDNTEAEKYISKDLLLDEVIELRTLNKVLEKKNRTKNILLGIILGAIGILAAVLCVVSIYSSTYNPYNHMGYSNYTGETIQSVADNEGISVKEIIDTYDLPCDMKGDTYWDVVTFMTPIYTMERNYQMAAEEIIAYFGFPEEVTRDWTMGEAYDILPLSKVVGEGDAFNEFIEKYGFDASVTPDTKWGKVRKQVDKVDYESYLAEQTEDVTE